MIDFKIRETGNELLRTLQDELSSRDSCRLTVDASIPENLFGDETGLCNSIITICRYLDHRITGLTVDIDLLRTGQYPELIQLKIEVKGSIADHYLGQFLTALTQDDIDGLISSLPYLTTYSGTEMSARFSFKMTFQQSGKRRRNFSIIR